jgi:signal transduction histidine kinase
MDIRSILKLSGRSWVFPVYAALAWVTGLVLFAWGPVWLGVDLPGLPFYKASLIRVVGGVLMAAGCFAAAMYGEEDSEVQRRGFIWFGIAHFVLGGVLLSQQRAIWGSPLADRLILLVFWAGVAFVFLAVGEEFGSGEGRGLQTLFTTSEAPHDALRSRYRRQIRDAALQEERHRLARDLHDSVKQQIFAIQTSAATAQTRFESDPAGTRAALDQVRTSAREAMAEMEAMLDQLRAAPLENAGLVAAIKKQSEALGFRTGAAVEVEVRELPSNFAVPPGAQQALFRVTQEALANVARHAKAKNLQY